MKVLILHTLPPIAADAILISEAPLVSENGQQIASRRENEFDVSWAAQNVASALPGAEVAGVRGELREILGLMDRAQPDVIFNLCEAPLGRPDLESQVAALFEWSGIRFTGCHSETLALCRRKDRTNAVLAAAGVPVPRTGVFPCIVKPADEDGSAGIHADSICYDPGMLERAQARLAGPAVVQEFLTGREFAVSLWGPRGPEYLAVGEVRFRNGLQLVTYAAKWDPESAAYRNSPVIYPAEIDAPLRASLVEIARCAWNAVGARGYLRVDLRLGADEKPRVLDLNPNPDLSPEGGFFQSVQSSGWNWNEFVRALVDWA